MLIFTLLLTWQVRQEFEIFEANFGEFSVKKDLSKLLRISSLLMLDFISESEFQFLIAFLFL